MILVWVVNLIIMKDDLIFCDNYGGFMKDMFLFSKFVIGFVVFVVVFFFVFGGYWGVFKFKLEVDFVFDV